jgi:FMN-dependent NADH-azoreductase
MYPWMPLTDDKVIEINSACIVSVANARPSFREQYEKFIDQINEQNNETEITEVDINQLSTSGSIKDLIEKLTEDLQSDDEEEQDHGNWEPPTRTLH